MTICRCCVRSHQLAKKSPFIQFLSQDLPSLCVFVCVMSAMQRKPVVTEVRTPTDTWSGLGFSKSMPAEAVKELRNISRRSYKPYLSTINSQQQVGVNIMLTCGHSFPLELAGLILLWTFLNSFELAHSSLLQHGKWAPQLFPPPTQSCLLVLPSNSFKYLSCCVVSTTNLYAQLPGVWYYRLSQQSHPSATCLPELFQLISPALKKSPAPWLLSS